MGPVRIAVLAVAAVAAIALFMMVRHMAAGPKPAPVVVAAAPMEKPTSRVLVAAHDLKVGTRLTRGDLNWQAWPVEALNPAFITDGAAPVTPPPPAHSPVGIASAKANEAVHVAGNLLSGGAAMDTVSGSVVREPILAGEPISDRKIVRAGDGGYMSVMLQPGMRAMALPVNAETGAGGFILPGDRVDILQSRRMDQRDSNGANTQVVVTQTLMTNLRVLAVDQTTQSDAKKDKAQVGATVTLEVPADDSEIIARAKTQGDFTLALRSYADAGGRAGRVAARTTTQEKIRVFRAGQSSDVAVNQ